MQNKTSSTLPLTIVVAAISLFGGLSMVNGQYPVLMNERFSSQAVRLLQGAQMTYAANYGNGNYGTMSSLGQSGLVDPALSSGRKYGYVFTMSITFASTTANANFGASVTPQMYGKTGRRSFFIDSFGQIHGADKGGQPATTADPVIDDCSTGSIAENERCTKYSMRFLSIAENIFSVTGGNGSYGSLSQLAGTGRIDPRLEAGSLRGYAFTVATNPASGQTPASFHVDAVPQIYGVTGTLSFFVDQTGQIRGADKQGGPGNAGHPPVQY